MLSSSGSLSEHQPVQWLQTLQFHSPKDCGREYSRVSGSSENQLMGQSVRLNMGVCRHYESVEFKNVSVAMAMITPEKANNTCLGFNPFRITKTSYIRFLYMQNASVWWLCKCPLLLSEHHNLCPNSRFLLLVY